MLRTWEKPKLVILVRSSSPEAVLQICKMSAQTGAISEDSGCYDYTGAVCGARGQLLGIGNALVCLDCSAPLNS